MTQQKIYAAGQVSAGSLTGSEQVEIDAGGAVHAFTTTQAIANLATVTSTNKTITALNTVGAGTVTAAGIVGGVTSRGGAQSATAFTDTTDTAAAIIAALPSGAPVGTDFFWTYENTTNGPATLAGGASVTISGNSVIPILTWAEYLVKVASATTVTVTFVKGGQLSPLPFSSFTTQTVTTLNTASLSGLTSAQIATLALSGMATAGGTIVLPAAVDLVGSIPNCRVGTSLQVNIINNGSATIQLSGLPGTIISGTSKIQVAKLQSYNLNIDSLGSATFTGLTQTALS